ncbi:MAG: ATP-binding cassette domain-containing protein, partial [Desulfobacteraceae bacterium]|nr:ATP-binding cassette domain-containing protein [Desulfobacteraceae bacterium]
MTDLILKDLKKTYNGKKVVNNVNIKVKKGSVTGLLGPNGAGKTTTFYMAVGLIRPDSGKVFLNNENITEHPMYIRARKGIGYLPQEPSTFKKLTVKQNITAILEVIHSNKNDINTKAENVMNELG